MLQDESMEAFLTVSDAARARQFYEGVLELTLVSDSDHLMVLRSGTSPLMLAKAGKVTPREGTALGWRVRDLRRVVAWLSGRGVVFERFDGMDQDEVGVWSPAPGIGVAWFKDPDGNLLSVAGPA